MSEQYNQCLPGKTKRVFLNPDTISRHLFCSICHEVFEEPQRLYCGHTFCYVCIQRWASVTKKCPICKEGMRRKLERDYIPALIIDELLVKCSHPACEWQGVHSLLKKHQRLCTHRIKKSQQSTAEKTWESGPHEKKQTIEISDTESDGIIQIPQQSHSYPNAVLGGLNRNCC